MNETNETPELPLTPAKGKKTTNRLAFNASDKLTDVMVARRDEFHLKLTLRETFNKLRKDPALQEIKITEGNVRGFAKKEKIDIQFKRGKRGGSRKGSALSKQVKTKVASLEKTVLNHNNALVSQYNLIKDQQRLIEAQGEEIEKLQAKYDAAIKDGDAVFARVAKLEASISLSKMREDGRTMLERLKAEQSKEVEKVEEAERGTFTGNPGGV